MREIPQKDTDRENEINLNLFWENIERNKQIEIERKSLVDRVG